MLSTTMPFCTSCAYALFSKPHLVHPVQICVPCPSMHLARRQVGMQCSMQQTDSCFAIHIRLAQCCAFSINIVYRATLIDYHQYSSVLCIRHQYGSMLCIRNHNYGSISLHHASIIMAQCCASIAHS